MIEPSVRCCSRMWQIFQETRKIATELWDGAQSDSGCGFWEILVTSLRPSKVQSNDRVRLRAMKDDTESAGEK